MKTYMQEFNEMVATRDDDSKLYYAKVKGWELIISGLMYWNLDVIDNEIVIEDKFGSIYFRTEFTKEEWSVFGITTANAEFEEVE